MEELKSKSMCITPFIACIQSLPCTRTVMFCSCTPYKVTTLQVYCLLLMLSFTGLKVRFNCGEGVLTITTLLYSHSTEARFRSNEQVIVTESPTLSGLLCPDTCRPAEIQMHQSIYYYAFAMKLP